MIYYLNKVITCYPFSVLFSIFMLSVVCCVVTITTHENFSFSDPKMGFDTRGTELSNRITTWKNLLEATKSSGQLISNPKELMEVKPRIKIKNHTKYKRKKHKMNKGNRTKISNKRIKNVNVENEDFFCGSPDQNYAKLIIEANDKSDLFNYQSMINICKIQDELTQIDEFSHLCVTSNLKKKCCRIWSLPNYIAFFFNKTSCRDITEDDINNMQELLQNCSHYYHQNKLTSDCSYRSYCDAPLHCIKSDGIYNIFTYLTTTEFMPLENINNTYLPNTLLVLPLACSIATLPYYKNIQRSYESLSIIAMDFGIKHFLFDDYLVSDAKFMVFGGIFIAICLLFYTKSMFLTIMIAHAILFSLAISYCIYTYVFGLKFFPFINMLAVVIAIGIGADDAFIFCKVYRAQKDNNISLNRLMNDTFNHSVVSMLVTSLTTGVAFFASYFSFITALKCFGLFTGMAVLINYLLMITWLPASVIVYEKYTKRKTSGILNHLKELISLNGKVFIIARNLPKYCEVAIINFIVRFKLFIFIVFTLISICSFIVIFYHPKLQLAKNNELQLFKSSHPFERYDFEYKNNYRFVHNEYFENYKLPLRFVFGVLPIDNGDFMNPQSLGSLKFDDSFNMASAESQKFLFDFCTNLRKQPFYEPTNGPLLENCFIDSFIKWMERSCLDPIIENITRYPCCEHSKFPFHEDVFNHCIIDSVADLYRTPSNLFLPGIAGPKFSNNLTKPTIKTVIIEYDSIYILNNSMNYELMNKFIDDVNNWTNEQFKNAPNTLRQGFFITDYEFYELQSILIKNTLLSIIISIFLALFVLFLTTLNIINSFFAIINITCSITTTIAILILIGWKLHFLETIAISSSFGITIDFSLHYCVTYNLKCTNNTNRTESVKYALSIMLGPITMSAITTAAAGCSTLFLEILAYKQIGEFLLSVILVSWCYSTFYLNSILALIGADANFLQYYCKRIFSRKKSEVNAINDVPKLSELKQLRIVDDSNIDL